jgi:FMN reductase [NAD(P)H]
MSLGNCTPMSYPRDVFSRMFGEEEKGGRDLLYPKEEKANVEEIDEALSTNIFNVMLSRRSQRKFDNRQVESSKVQMVYAAADTAPTAGGFQGFEIYHVKRDEMKVELVEAANKQPYVNAPVVLVFCMNPERIKMNFSATILRKFSLQDATLAAAYAQLAAHALGLSSIWIGMIDEEKIMSILNTKYVPSSILCLGYPQKLLQPKPKRNLMGLIHEV